MIVVTHPTRLLVIKKEIDQTSIILKKHDKKCGGQNGQKGKTLTEAEIKKA
jgi:hypothetical protein